MQVHTSDNLRPLRKGWRTPTVLFLLGLLVVVSLAHLVGLGSSHWTVGQVVSEFIHPSDTPLHNVLWELRLPRLTACLLVGAILGMVGASFQALFRNPLAEPYVVGVSSGAAVGGSVAIAIGFGASWTGFAEGLGPMLLAFPSGLGSLMLVFAIATRRGMINVHTLLLAGVVTGSLLSAVLSFIMLAAGQDTNRILAWLLGSLTPMFWNRVVIMAIATFGGGTVLHLYSKQLNAFAVGEETAQRLGVNVNRLKPVVLVVGTAMVATTVGAVGIIGFLGLVAPHLTRRLLGIDWRVSLWGSGLTGAILLCVSDLVAQRLIPSLEIPVGIVTAILGAPFLLVLMRRRG